MNYHEPADRRSSSEFSAERLRKIVQQRMETPFPHPLRDRLARIAKAWPLVAAWVALCAALASIYCVMTPPQYLATTQVVLEPRQPSISSDAAAQSTAPTLDSALADSQVQVLTSERNLRYVFVTQNLVSDPEFSEPGLDLVGKLLSRLPLPGKSDAQSGPDIKREQAFQRFSNQVSVRRLAQSYAFELAFSSTDPDKAARLANATTAAFIRDKVLYNISAAAAQRGGDFLQTRVADTKAEVDAADAAVKTGVIPDYIFGHADARIISSAIRPLRKAYPKTALILIMSIAFALLSGAAFAFLFDELDRKPRSARRLWLLTGLTATASLPYVKAFGDPSLNAQGLGDAAQRRPFGLELARLSVAIQQFANAESRPVVGVISLDRGEGASFVSLFLAASLAQAGTSVALVDADAQHFTLTRRLAPQGQRRAADDPGATSILTTSAPNLEFLPAAALPEDRSKAATGFGAAIAACTALSETRLVLVDLAPLSNAADTLAISRSLSAVVVVVGAAAQTVDGVARLIDSLAQSDVRVLGLVLNKVQL